MQRGFTQRTCGGFHCFLVVYVCFHISTGLPIRFHLFLLVHHVAMHHPWNLELVGEGAIAMEDDLPVCKMFGGKGFPLHLPHSSRVMVLV